MTTQLSARVARFPAVAVWTLTSLALSGCATNVETSPARATAATSAGAGGSGGGAASTGPVSASGGPSATSGSGGAGGVASGAIELATGQDHPSRIALDDANVYFTDVYGGTVNRVPKAGGATTVLANANVPMALAVNATNVYYLALSADESADVVNVVPKTGGAGTTIASIPSSGDGIADIAATDQVLYYFITSAGLQPVPLETQPDFGVIGPGAMSAGVAIADGSVYWWTATATTCGEDCQTYDYAIRSASVYASPAVLATGTGQIKGIAADAAHVYWIADTTLFVGDPAGGLEQALYTSTGTLGGVATDGTDVYVTDTYSGTVIRLSPSTGGATTIATMQPGPQAIAVDAQAVYWANFYGGTVMKAPKL